MIYSAGDTSVTVDVQIVDDDGLPVTGLVASTFPTTKYSRAGANADVAISLSDLATLTTAWSAGGVKERGEGYYRLDLPDAVFSTYGVVSLRGETSGKRLLASRLQVGEHDLFAAAGRIGTGRIDVVSSVTPDGDVYVRMGNDYLDADGLAIDFVDDDDVWPVLTAGTVEAQVSLPGTDFTKAMSIIIGAGVGKTVRLELTAANLHVDNGFRQGVFDLVVVATLSNGHTVTLVDAKMHVEA